MPKGERRSYLEQEKYILLIYTRVSDRELDKIKNPLDTVLFEDVENENK